MTTPLERAAERIRKLRDRSNKFAEMYDRDETREAFLIHNWTAAGLEDALEIIEDEWSPSAPVPTCTIGICSHPTLTAKPIGIEVRDQDGRLVGVLTLEDFEKTAAKLRKIRKERGE